MKILILGFSKIKYLPYMHFFLNCINEKDNDIHLVYWDRDNKADAEVDSNIVLHRYDHKMLDSIPLYKKIIPIMGFGRFARKAINAVEPDFLIVLHSTTAITICQLLAGRYKERYIFDFRDLTYEKNCVYRRLIGSIVKNSVATFTSSDGFREFLPKECTKIYTSHNLLASSMVLHKNYNSREKRKQFEPIRIAFWGMIRHYTINETIITKLGNDSRFELHYYGRAGERIKGLLQQATQQYKNIFYHGEYLPQDRDKFARNTDLLHNMYDNNDKTMFAAMGNKYYDGLIYYIPQICSKGSFMGARCEEYGVGIMLDPNVEEFVDTLYEYYRSLDYERFKLNCDSALENVVTQVRQDEEVIRTCIKSVE